MDFTARLLERLYTYSKQLEYAPSLPRKDNRFDQELPSIRGSKVWRKGSLPVAWLDGMVEILVGFNLRCTRERDIPKNVFFLREKVLIYDAPSLPRKDNRFD